jgi:hypothetical protein
MIARVGVFLLLLGCASVRRDPIVLPNGGIKGTVVDVDTGAPLEGAVVMVRRQGKVRGPSLSNVHGDFILAPLRDGVHDLIVERPGYETASAEKIPVENGYYTKIAVKLRRGSSPAGEQLPLSPPQLLSGPPLRYPEREVEGTLLVACIITVEGEVTECIPDQEVPELAPMIRALEERRYRPAMQEGTPVQVTYVFRITLHAL